MTDDKDDIAPEAPATEAPESQSKAVILPLPKSAAELQARRHTRPKAFNDRVQDHLDVLFDRPEFRKYFEAVDPDDTVEGSFEDDLGTAARILRDHAFKNGDLVVGKAQAKALKHAIWIVLRRSEATWKQRRRAAGL